MKQMLLITSVYLALFFGITTVHAQEDITAPTLLEVNFEPKGIDTSKGPATITVTVHVTDDLSGVDHVALFFRKPTTTQTAQVEFREDEGWSEIIRGDELDGVHQATMTLPQFAAQGEWEMFEVILSDKVGNQADFYKPEDKGEDELTEDEWPSLYNGFAFAVGEEVPQQPVRRLYIPSITIN